MWDIDVSNPYSRQQFLMLISCHIRSQKRELRQAKLVGDKYRYKKALLALRRFKDVYIKAYNWEQ